jgi:hypothetical protein
MKLSPSAFREGSRAAPSVPLDSWLRRWSLLSEDDRAHGRKVRHLASGFVPQRSRWLRAAPLRRASGRCHTLSVDAIKSAVDTLIGDYVLITVGQCHTRLAGV